MLGYNYGAGVYSRVKAGIRFLALFSFTYAALAWAAVMLFAEPIVRVFNNDPALVRIATPAMRTYFCGFVFMALQMAGQSVFLSLGRSRQANFFSLLRKVVIVVPLIFLLPYVGGWGVDGIFWSEPISDLLGGAACFATMIFVVYRKLGEDKPVRLEE